MGPGIPVGMRCEGRGAFGLDGHSLWDVEHHSKRGAPTLSVSVKIDDPSFVCVIYNTLHLTHTLKLTVPKLTLVPHPGYLKWGEVLRIQNSDVCPRRTRVPGYKRSKLRKSTKNQKPSLNQDAQDDYTDYYDNDYTYYNYDDSNSIHFQLPTGRWVVTFTATTIGNFMMKFLMSAGTSERQGTLMDLLTMMTFKDV
jgi:hypothetical protein